MKICARCKTQVNDNEQYCPRCGNAKFVAPSQPGGTQINTQQRTAGQQVQRQPQNQNGQQVQRQTQNQNTMNNGQQVQRQPQNTNNMNNGQQVQRQPQNQNNMNNGQPQGNRRLKPGQQPAPAPQPTPAPATNPVAEDAITLKQWLITIIILVIPIANIVYLVLQLKNQLTPVTKKNFLKAYAIYYVAALVLSLVISVIISAI
jgi:hypothetical protein